MIDQEPKPQACGMMRHHGCCVFLSLTTDGYICERDRPVIHDWLVRRAPHMSAQRIPTEPFPDCMIFKSEGDP